MTLKALKARIARLEARHAPEMRKTCVITGADPEPELRRLYGDGPRPDNLFVVRLLGPNDREAVAAAGCVRPAE
jgi:hypothetical protein